MERPTTDDHDPTRQFWHVTDVVELVTEDHVPAIHAEHVVEAVTLENVP